ncbi:cyclopropane fatty-acyl-phospholipid synthase-like methyltransferase [Pedobacter sp. UYEF25]
MKKNSNSLGSSYFDKVYEENSDPWNFEKSEYEREKYSKTIESLSKEKYKTALEIGCSIGVLTQRLAERCVSLISIDISKDALKSAKDRLKDLSNVQLHLGSIPTEIPVGPFDLIVMSEVGYYLCMDDLKIAKEEIKRRLDENGELVLVHWTHEVADYPLSGDEVNELFLKDEDFKLIHQFKTQDYRLEVFTKR